MNQVNDLVYQFITNPLGHIQIVGFGSYGQVKLAKNRKTGQIAHKQINNKNAKQEIDVHHKLDHPNIIKLMNYYYEKDKHITYMILQYASGGSLNQKIKQSFGFLNKSLIHRYFKQICEAVKYLHDNGYMHRDIKPQNILINKQNNIKLCDFGFASLLEYRSTVCGTFQYMAPQMIQKKPYDYRIDIWALGILLFEMIQGKAPFKGNTPDQVIGEMKKTIHFSNRFESVEIDLIKKILRVNAENRIQVKDILQHPYFSFYSVYQEQIIKHPSQIQIKKQKKMDFLPKKTQKIQKKQELPKEQTKRQQRNFFVQQKRQFPIKQVYQQKRQQTKAQFKPYIPSNIQNKNIIKPAITKPQLNATTISPPIVSSNFNNSRHLPMNQPTITHQNVTIGSVSSKQLPSMNVPPTFANYALHSQSQQYLNPNVSRPFQSGNMVQPKPQVNMVSSPNLYWRKQ